MWTVREEEKQQVDSRAMKELNKTAEGGKESI